MTGLRATTEKETVRRTVSYLPRAGSGVLPDGDRLQPLSVDDGQLKYQVRQKMSFRVLPMVILEERRMQGGVNSVFVLEIQPVNGEVLLSKGLFATHKRLFEEMVSLKVSRRVPRLTYCLVYN